MLEKLRHYRPATYRKLMDLDRDFQQQGELYQYLRTTFALSDRQVERIVRNTAEAARILRQSCKAGKLRFDLDPETYLRTGQVSEQRPDCN